MVFSKFVVSFLFTEFPRDDSSPRSVSYSRHSDTGYVVLFIVICCNQALNGLFSFFFFCPQLALILDSLSTDDSPATRVA